MPIMAKNIDDNAGIRPGQLQGHGQAMANLPLTLKDVRYVDSTRSGAVDTPNFGKHHDKNPWATLKYALTQADANTLIRVMPGHTESISVAPTTIDTGDPTTYMFANVGVWVQGMGWGAQRPTITFDTVVGAGLRLDRASCVLQNLLLLSGIDDLTKPVEMYAADGTLLDMEWRDASAMETVDVIWIVSGGTRCVIDGIIVRGNSGGNSGQSAIHIDGADDIIVTNFDLFGDYQTGVIENVGDECLRCRILGGNGRFIGGTGSRIWTDAPEDLAIALDTNATGYIEGPIGIRLKDNAANIDQAIVPGKCQVYNTTGKVIGIVNADGESELQWPGTPSTDA